MLLFLKNIEKRTRRANNSQNLPASRTQRTQGRNIPFGGTPHSDLLGLIFHFQLDLTFSFRPKLLLFSYWCGDSPSRANFTSIYIRVRGVPARDVPALRVRRERALTRSENSVSSSRDRREKCFVIAPFLKTRKIFPSPGRATTTENFLSGSELPPYARAGLKYPMRGNPSL